MAAKGARDFNKRLSPAGAAAEEQASENGTPHAAVAPPPVVALELEISPNDPIVAYFQGANGPVVIDSLEIDSPALERLKEQRRNDHDREQARVETMTLDEIALNGFRRRAA